MRACLLPEPALCGPRLVAATAAGSAAHVFWTAPEALVATGDEMAASWTGLLSPEERTRWRSFRDGVARQQFAAGRILLRTALSRYVRVSRCAWRFRAEQAGRPEIRVPDVKPPLYFNLSHVDGLVACIVGRVPQVGIDVERLDRRIDMHALAEVALCPLERAEMAALPPEERQARLLSLWAIKEATLKALGFGLRRAPHTVCASFPRAHPPQIRIALDDPRSSLDWRIDLFRPTQRHVVATSVALQRDGALQLRVTDLNRTVQRFTCRTAPLV